MINIVKKELEFDDEIKKKIEFICGFCNITPTIINSNIRKEMIMDNIVVVRGGGDLATGVIHK